MKPMKALFAALPILGAGIFFACSTHVAGGSSEETNTIAGTLTLPSGEAAARPADDRENGTPEPGKES